MAIAGPDGVDAAIKAGVDLDGRPITEAMLALYNQVMDLESQRARSGVLKSMRNRVVKTGAKHFDQDTLNQRLLDAGWDGLKDKEIAFFYGVSPCDGDALPGSILAELLHRVDHLWLELFQGTGLAQIKAFASGVLGQVLEMKGSLSIGKELNRRALTALAKRIAERQKRSVFSELPIHRVDMTE